MSRWTEVYGSAAAARAAGVRGRIALVDDGEHTWIAHTVRRSAGLVLSDYVASADYQYAGGPITLRARILDAADREVDACLCVVSPLHARDPEVQS